MSFFSKLRERLTKSSSKIGQGLDDLAPPVAGAAPVVPRDVFLFVISGAKERNPAAAMALISRP